MKYLNQFIGKYSAPDGGPPRKIEEPTPQVLTKLTKPPPEPAKPPPQPWDQSEADRLLDQLHRETGRLERTWPGGKFPQARVKVVQIAVEVCESYVRDHEREAARGWDALALLRDAVPWAIGLATPPARSC